MQTPNTPRGRETERLMLLWRKENPDADASAYNREWDSVYRKLADDHSVHVEAYNEVMQDTTDPGGFLADVAPMKQRPRDPRHKHAAQTKGAFGKPKPLRRR